jgi:hypothetical protein
MCTDSYVILNSFVIFVISKRQRDFVEHQRACGENALPGDLWRYRLNHDQHKLFRL